MADRIDPIRGDIAELRQEIRAMRQQFEQSFTLLTKQLEPVHAKLEGLARELHEVDKRIDKTGIRLVMWSAGFWIAAVGAVAALAGVFRR